MISFRDFLTVEPRDVSLTPEIVERLDQELNSVEVLSRDGMFEQIANILDKYGFEFPNMDLADPESDDLFLELTEGLFLRIGYFITEDVKAAIIDVIDDEILNEILNEEDSQ